MNTVPTPTTALALHEINPAGFDFGCATTCSAPRTGTRPEGNDNNLMVPIEEAVRSQATVGEIVRALNDVFRRAPGGAGRRAYEREGRAVPDTAANTGG
jgi:hypothetical protein